MFSSVWQNIVLDAHNARSVCAPRLFLFFFVFVDFFFSNFISFVAPWRALNRDGDDNTLDGIVALARHRSHRSKEIQLEFVFSDKQTEEANERKMVETPHNSNCGLLTLTTTAGHTNTDAREAVAAAAAINRLAYTVWLYRAAPTTIIQFKCNVELYCYQRRSDVRKWVFVRVCVCGLWVFCVGSLEHFALHPLIWVTCFIQLSWAVCYKTWLYLLSICDLFAPNTRSLGLSGTEYNNDNLHTICHQFDDSHTPRLWKWTQKTTQNYCKYTRGTRARTPNPAFAANKNKWKKYICIFDNVFRRRLRTVVMTMNGDKLRRIRRRRRGRWHQHPSNVYLRCYCCRRAQHNTSLRNVEVDFYVVARSSGSFSFSVGRLLCVVCFLIWICTTRSTLSISFARLLVLSVSAFLLLLLLLLFFFWFSFRRID